MQVSHPVGRSVMLWWSLTAQWGRFCKLWRRQVWSTILSFSSLATTGRCGISVSSFMSVSMSHDIYICVRSQARANAEVTWGKRRTDEMWQRHDLRRRNERAGHRILAWIDPTRCWEINGPTYAFSCKKYTTLFLNGGHLFDTFSHPSKVSPVLWPALWTFCPPLPNWLGLHYPRCSWTGWTWQTSCSIKDR